MQPIRNTVQNIAIIEVMTIEKLTGLQNLSVIRNFNSINFGF